MFSFKKKQRLLNKSDYEHVFAHAKKTITKDFVILGRKNELGHARLGLALSKKMIAKAHDRNRIKRLLREQFRKEALPAIDLIFLARHGVATESNAMIQTRLSDTWKQLNAYYGK